MDVASGILAVTIWTEVHFNIHQQDKKYFRLATLCLGKETVMCETINPFKKMLNDDKPYQGWKFKIGRFQSRHSNYTQFWSNMTLVK